MGVGETVGMALVLVVRWRLPAQQRGPWATRAGKEEACVVKAELAPMARRVVVRLLLLLGRTAAVIRCLWLWLWEQEGLLLLELEPPPRTTTTSRRCTPATAAPLGQRDMAAWGRAMAEGLGLGDLMTCRAWEARKAGDTFVEGKPVAVVVVGYGQVSVRQDILSISVDKQARGSVVA